MKALTLVRPWAWALFHGKPVENRSWAIPEKCLGEQVAIHAGKGWDDHGEWMVRRETGLASLPPEARATGVVGVLTFDRVISLPGEDPLLSSRWFFGPFGWVHRDGVELAEPVPCRGMLGLWTLPPDVEAEVRRQLAELQKETPC